MTDRIEMTDGEKWLPVLGYENAYAVSNLGRVKSLSRMVHSSRGGQQRVKERILKPKQHKTGYLIVSLCREGGIKDCRVHRLVLEAFVGPCPEGMEALHSPDRNPSNNKLSNLRWGTSKENSEDTFKHGNRPVGVAHASSKLKEDDVRSIRKLLSAPRCSRLTVEAIARMFGVCHATVSYIKSGKRWKHLR